MVESMKVFGHYNYLQSRGGFVVDSTRRHKWCLICYSFSNDLTWLLTRILPIRCTPCQTSQTAPH